MRERGKIAYSLDVFEIVRVIFPIPAVQSNLKAQTPGTYSANLPLVWFRRTFMRSLAWRLFFLLFYFLSFT